MSNYGELFVKRTKILYMAVALMLFGALGIGVQMSETAKTVEVVAPALTDACKDYNFYKGHADACSTAAVVTSNASEPPAAPGSVTNVVADRVPLLTSANR